MTQVSALLGGLALLLAATGLYGSMSFTSSQRTREMGIRLALGASRGQVACSLILRGTKIAAVGCVVGLVLVLVAFQLMTGLIFGKWTLDLAALAAVSAVFALVTLAACWLPARRASNVDPMVALRTD
jgi:putative ABC transport system permease protein